MKGWNVTKARFEKLLELKTQAEEVAARLEMQLPDECYVCEQGGPEAYERPEEVSCTCPPPAPEWLVEAAHRAGFVAIQLDRLCAELYENCRPKGGPSRKAAALERAGEQ